MPRVYERKFDWEEAARLRKTGLSFQEIADRCGVSSAAIYLALDSAARRRQRAYLKRWQQTVCVDCGGPASRTGSRSGHPRCKRCGSIARATSVREHELRCSTCKQWKHDSAFPGDQRRPIRRHRGHQCTACGTLAKRLYRERRRVPCESCGEQTSPANERVGKRLLCLSCWHASRVA